MLESSTASLGVRAPDASCDDDKANRASTKLLRNGKSMANEVKK